MKKICLVCDVPNWAFDIIAKKLAKSFEDEFDIEIAYFDVREKADFLFEFIEEHKDSDLIHFFWRKTLLQMEGETFIDKVKRKYGNYEEYIQKISEKVSTGVYDFLFLKDEEIGIYKNVFNKFSKKYYVTSKRLFDTYLKINEYKKPYGVVHDICDTSKMLPMNSKRFEDFERPLVIGWVGNSAIKYDGVDLKGFNSIIKPIVSELINEGYNLKGHYADRNEKWRSSEEMPIYYSEIDVCLCMSIMEGTPLPILEAMSCGVPIITTDVGVVSEALDEKQKEYIIGDRAYGENDESIKKILEDKIIEIYNNREILKELSEENLQSIVEYDGGKILEEYRRYFQNF